MQLNDHFKNIVWICYFNMVDDQTFRVNGFIFEIMSIFKEKKLFLMNLCYEN